MQTQQQEPCVSNTPAHTSAGGTKPHSVSLEVLSTFRGHKNFFLEDSNVLEERVKLAVHVATMIGDGFTVFLIDDQDRQVCRRIKEYDPSTNEWVLYSTRTPAPQAPVEESNTQTEAKTAAEEAPIRRKRGRPRKTERVSAEGTTATAVAATAGG